MQSDSNGWCALCTYRSQYGGPEALLYVVEVSHKSFAYGTMRSKTPYELLHRKKSSGLALKI